MKVRRRTNLLWGVILLALAVVILLRAFAVIPDGIYDLIVRAWPVLLVLGGLSVFLRDRVPLGSLIALVVSVVLVGGLTAMAFSTRANQERSDYVETIMQPISGDVTLLEVSIETLATTVDVEILPLPIAEVAVSGEFSGSTESKIQIEYSEQEGRALFHLTEIQSREFPMLETVGRGRLKLALPPDLPLDVAFSGGDGDARFDMSELALERLNITLGKGDALVTLPEYVPLSPNVSQQPGNLRVREGNITIFVPETVSPHFELDRGGSGIEPQFDPLLYNYLVGDVLEARNYDDAEIKPRYLITVPRGLIRIQTPQ